MASISSGASPDPQFPCSIALRIPLPTPRLAATALRALQVDPELSPLVRRQLSVGNGSDAEARVLRVDYRATTNRMLRVAVNSFMDSLKLVLDVMEQLDVHVLAQHSRQQPQT
ncbi:Uncharacterized protein TPAR_08572 [Tolypocladium paradoxum]|uniref:Uncharacterized protein n=1 Tax=Tolypocladium paradoxum TaxID=94208 RepID=A0A2S4KM18_9HYPO|nr:Uncharacterized protein TPAR_08572 [Tolypocladium paradoxum]